MVHPSNRPTINYGATSSSQNPVSDTTNFPNSAYYWRGDNIWKVLQVSSLADIRFDILSNNDMLMFDSSDNQWKNVNVTTLDSRVAVDAAATSGYLGSTAGTGVLRADNTISYTDNGDYVTLSVPGNNVDHGNLSGLSDDDHTQYFLTDGTRDITGATTIAHTGTQIDFDTYTIGATVYPYVDFTSSLGSNIGILNRGLFIVDVDDDGTTSFGIYNDDLSLYARLDLHDNIASQYLEWSLSGLDYFQFDGTEVRFNDGIQINTNQHLELRNANTYISSDADTELDLHATGAIHLNQNTTIGDGTAATDFALTFDGESNDGVLTWMEDEDYFSFSDDILMNSTERLYLSDTNSSVYHDGTNLTLIDDTAIDLDQNTNITGSLDVSSTLTSSGVTILGDDVTGTGEGVSLFKTSAASAGNSPQFRIYGYDSKGAVTGAGYASFYYTDYNYLHISGDGPGADSFLGLLLDCDMAFNGELRFPASGRCYFLWDDGGVTDYQKITLTDYAAGNDTTALVICNDDQDAYDFGIPQVDDPRLYICSHDSSQSKNIYLMHDGTDGNIVIGSGDLNLNPASNVTLGLTNNALNFNDTNTQIWEDASDNLSFKDANAGTITLTELKSMRNIWISSTGEAEGNKTFSDGTNWNAEYSFISSIKIETSSTDWDMWLMEDITDQGGGTWDTSLLVNRQVASNLSGDADITIMREYNPNSTNVYIVFTDNSGANTFNIYIIGEARRH